MAPRGVKPLATMMASWDQRKRVLLVAPRATVTAAIAPRLRREGLVVDEAHSVEQAFARVDWREYDVIIAYTAAEHGKLGGLTEFAQFTRKCRPHAVFIELSVCKESKPGRGGTPGSLRIRAFGDGAPEASTAQRVCQTIADAIAFSERKEGE